MELPVPLKKSRPKNTVAPCSWSSTTSSKGIGHWVASVCALTARTSTVILNPPPPFFTISGGDDQRLPGFRYTNPASTSVSTCCRMNPRCSAGYLLALLRTGRAPCFKRTRRGSVFTGGPLPSTNLNTSQCSCNSRPSLSVHWAPAPAFLAFSVLSLSNLRIWDSSSCHLIERSGKPFRFHFFELSFLCGRTLDRNRHDLLVSPLTGLGQ